MGHWEFGKLGNWERFDLKFLDLGTWELGNLGVRNQDRFVLKFLDLGFWI